MENNILISDKETRDKTIKKWKEMGLFLEMDDDNDIIESIRFCKINESYGKK